MRWLEPIVGDQRVTSYFAFFPVTINYETRWLERVKIRQEFRQGRTRDFWVYIKFIDS